MLIFGKWKRWESRRNELNSLFISLKSENSNTVRFDATNFKFPAHLCKCGHKNRLNFQSFSLVTFNFVGSCNGHWIIGPFLKTFGAILNCFNWNSDCRGIWNSGKEFLQCSSVLSRKIRRWTGWMSLVTSRRVNIELAAIDREKRNRCSSTFFLFPRCITIFFFSLSLIISSILLGGGHSNLPGKKSLSKSVINRWKEIQSPFNGLFSARNLSWNDAVKQRSMLIGCFNFISWLNDVKISLSFKFIIFLFLSFFDRWSIHRKYIELIWLVRDKSHNE